MLPKPRVANVGSTVSVLGVRAMFEYAAECGVDVNVLMRELGLDPGLLRKPDSRISLRVVQRAWHLAAARSHDDSFGLHAAERAGLGTFEALDYALWASTTLDDLLDRLGRFHRVIGDDLHVDKIRSGKWVRLRRVVAHDQRHRAEMVLALVALRVRELCGRSFRLHEVRFMHRAPADVRLHRAVFRCPVRFGCTMPELVFAADQLTLPVRTAKPGLASVLDRHLDDLLARLPQGDTFVARVDDAIARTLHVGPPSLARTATTLRVSPRTVQRQLQDSGVSHRKLVDGVRRELAERLLADSRMSISEIAFLLGFDDVSGFRRAYRKWTGKSASQSRAE